MNKLKFHQILQQYIKESSYSIKRIAELTHIERSMIQHYISGNRFPSSYANIEKITNILLLSDSQKNLLKSTYNIEKIGYKKYERLQLIKEIIENIYYSKEITNYDYNLLYSFEKINKFADNYEDLKIMIRYIIDQAKHSSSSTLNAYLPSNQAIYHILATNLQASTPLSMKMLINLENSQDRELSSIKQFKNLLPIIFLDNTDLRYLYSNLSFCQDNTFSYPYYLGSDSYGLLINSTLTSAILIDNDINNYLFHQFDHTFNQSEPLYQKMSDLNNIINCYQDAYKPSMQLQESYSFMSEPCIIPALDLDLVQRMYTGPQEMSKYVENFILLQKNNMLTALKNKAELSFYLTKSGLESFYRHGRVTDIPSVFYTPILPKDVMLILQRIVNLAKSYPNYKIYLIDEKKFNFPAKLTINFNNTNFVGLLVGGKSDDSTITIAILEPILKNEFISLKELIDIEESCYSQEYTLSYLQSFIQTHSTNLTK